MSQISFSSNSLSSYHKENYDLIGEVINLSSERKEIIKCIPTAEENHLSNIQSLVEFENIQEIHSDVSLKYFVSKNSQVFEESGGEVGEGQGFHCESFYDVLFEEFIQDDICKNYIYYN
ncbi:hypothetical protein SteCoe_32368 [Stentor coeruleus]|uniref:Uncharacterized protein n=1 Tax=Stentor coeruleus TaxID=5963 RepID=A0A1R2AZ67_9CILI|nr:hypothetical protein SteCoe_32368 [Stentor coeruleus]